MLWHINQQKVDMVSYRAGINPRNLADHDGHAAGHQTPRDLVAWGLAVEAGLVGIGVLRGTLCLVGGGGGTLRLSLLPHLCDLHHGVHVSIPVPYHQGQGNLIVRGGLHGA